jgi:hypothetical protein
MASNSALIIPPRTNAPSVAFTNDIRPIKPPVPVPNPWSWVFWSSGVLLLAALVITVVLTAIALRVRRAFATPVPAHVRARDAINAALHSINDPRAFCTAVSNALRSYLEAHFHLRASESTTEEFLRELQNALELTPPQKQTLATFLDQCDLVKFARFEPNEAALRELHDSALAIGGFLSQPVLLIVVAAHYIAWLRMSGALTLHQQPASKSSTPFIGWILKATSVLGAEIVDVLSNSWLIAIPGLLIGVVGLSAIVLALTAFRYRAKWFFWAVVLYDVVLLGAAPVGTGVGLLLLAFCLWRRDEFFPEPRLK